jgi:hypothetical protein
VSGRIGNHLRSNVVGYIALFIALGGAAYAAGLARDSVKSKQIKAGAVKSSEVADGSLTGADVADAGLTGADVADAGLTGADVADDSLTGADVQESSLDLPAGGQADTPQQLLDKLITVDGAGSGLAADALDDLDSSNLYTKTEADGRYPLADLTFFNLAASATNTYLPFASFLELDMACDVGGTPSMSLKNVSGGNLRVYTDTGATDPVTNAPLANNASTAAIPGPVADGTADHVTYLVRGPAGTVSLDAWVENMAAPTATNCLFNLETTGQGIGLTLN